MLAALALAGCASAHEDPDAGTPERDASTVPDRGESTDAFVARRRDEESGADAAVRILDDP